MPSIKRRAPRDAPVRPRFQKAYEVGAPARAALSSAELLPVTIDVRVALARVRGSFPGLALLEREIVLETEWVPGIGLSQLRSCVDALAFAQTAYLSVEKGDPRIRLLIVEATGFLHLLMCAAGELAEHDLIDAKRLARVNVSMGYVKTARNLGAVARILRDRWPAIASKTLIDVDDLDRAERLARELSKACADRRANVPKVKAAAEERQRAYTLLLRAYDEVRRSVVYLRWNVGDAETIAPSLWAGRGRRRLAGDRAVSPREPRAGDVRAGDSGGGAGEDRGEAQSTEQDAAGAQSRLH